MKYVTEVQTTNPDGDLDSCGYLECDGTYTLDLGNLMNLGEEYTFSIYMKANAAKSVSFEDTTFSITTDWERFVYTFVAIETQHIKMTLPEGNYYLYKAQLELTSEVTTWKLNSSDYATQKDLDEMSASIAETEATLNSRLDIINDSIIELSSMLATLVVDENGSTMMYQTASGWQFSLGNTLTNISAIQARINEILDDETLTSSEIRALLDELNDEYCEMRNYINFESVTVEDENGDSIDSPAIILGNTENNFLIRITSVSIDFMYKDEDDEDADYTTLAWISKDSLFITKAVVQEELQFGNFAFKQRSNGNMGIVYVSEEDE